MHLTYLDAAFMVMGMYMSALLHKHYTTEPHQGQKPQYHFYKAATLTLSSVPYGFIGENESKRFDGSPKCKDEL